MTRVYRALSQRYRDSVLSGHGAALYPGRWNRRGEAVVYTAASQALALLELLPYLVSPFPELLLAELEVPDELVATLDVGPGAAQALFGDAERSREITARWLGKRRSVALAVPSVHLPADRWQAEPNVLLDPGHPQFGEVRICGLFPFRYDSRLPG